MKKKSLRHFFALMWIREAKFIKTFLVLIAFQFCYSECKFVDKVGRRGNEEIELGATFEVQDLEKFDEIGGWRRTTEEHHADVDSMTEVSFKTLRMFYSQLNDYKEILSVLRAIFLRQVMSLP